MDVARNACLPARGLRLRAMEGSGESGDIWIFTFQDGHWLWIHRDPDGNEIARSSRGFDTLESCQAAAERFGYRRQDTQRAH